jgi:hypothetical protein
VHEVNDARSGSHADRRRAPHRSLLGDLLVREGLISPRQLQEALQQQAALPTYAPLGQILVQSQALSQQQLNLVLDRHHERARLGELLIQAEVLTEEQLAAALDHQRRTGARLGDGLVKLGLATESQVKEALCKQFQVPFIDLDGVALDPGLARMVSRAYANHHRVLPLARLGDRLTVVIDDPAATEVLEDLRTATGCRIDVVTATGAAIDRARERLYERHDGGPFFRALQVAESERVARDSAKPTAGRETTRAAADLRESPRVILQPHESLSDRLTGIERRLADLGHAIERLAAFQDRPITERPDAPRHEDEAIRRSLRDLDLRQQEILRHLTELRAAPTAMHAARDAATDALREATDQARAVSRERHDTADAIEAILRRLTREEESQREPVDSPRE